MLHAIVITAIKTHAVCKPQTLMAILTAHEAMSLSTNLTDSQISTPWSSSFIGWKIDVSPTSLPLQLNSAIRPLDMWRHRGDYVPRC